jgi:cyanophycin synthetase
MTKNFKLLLQEAHELGLSVDIIYPEKEVAEISTPSRKIIVKEVFSFPIDPLSASSVIAKNKEVTYRIWEREGIPTPRGHYFKNITAFPKNAEDFDLKFPVILKKSNGKKSIGLRQNIPSFPELTKITAESDGSFIVQEMARGKEYRLLIYKDRLLGALEHAPPQVVGDGVSDISLLIQKRNLDFKVKIPMDDTVIQTLAKYGLRLESIPEKDIPITLLETCCLSEGATSADCTDIVHPEMLQLAIKAAQTCNMRLAGIDVICKDISLGPSDQDVFFLETNSFPSLNIHYTPIFGAPRRVIRDILEDVFQLNKK